jgi:hypothetical protein
MKKYHKHHIKPRHMGGTDDSSNIELLAVQEHANRHFELWYMCGKMEDYIAWKFLSFQYTNEEYENDMRILGGKWHKGKEKSIIHCEKISESSRGNKNGKGNKGKTRKLTQDKRTNLPDKSKPIKYKGNRSDTLSLTYKAISPEGKETIIKNMKKHCLENGISPGNAWAVLNKRQIKTKGWKFFYMV